MVLICVMNVFDIEITLIIIIVGNDTLVCFFKTQISDIFANFGGQSRVVNLTTFLHHICSIHTGKHIQTTAELGPAFKNGSTEVVGKIH